MALSLLHPFAYPVCKGWVLTMLTIYLSLRARSTMPYERLDSPTHGSSQEPPPPPLLTTAGTDGPAAPVVLYSTPVNTLDHYQGRTSVLLGAVQIGGGVFSIAIQAVLIYIHSLATYFGSGVWCGVMVSDSFQLLPSTHSKANILM